MKQKRNKFFTRYKLKGYVVWCLKSTGWFRIGRFILRWEVQ